ncbi:MAG: serine/threonine-protein kinase, partial [Myxococcota bacterium]
MTASTSSEPQKGPVIRLPIGTCIRGELIGTGGQAEVFRGVLRYPHDRERPCALKFLHSKHASSDRAVAQFVREAMLGLALTSEHPNIVTTRGFGQTDEGRLFLVTDLVEGPTVAQAAKLLRDEHALIRAVTDGALYALDHLHRHGYIHCDVSMGNLMMSRDGRVKLVDLGMVRRQESLFTAPMGVAAYKSPEELSRIGVTPLSDLYSLGAVLYEVLQGYPPYGAHSFIEVHRRMQQGPPAPLPTTTPDDLRDLVTGLMNHDPDERLTLEEAAEILDRTNSVRFGEEIAKFVARWKAVGSPSMSEQETLVGFSGRIVQPPQPQAGQDQTQAQQTPDTQELKVAAPAAVNYTEPGCSSTSSVGLYQHVGTALSGRDYWAVDG